MTKPTPEPTMDADASGNDVSTPHGTTARTTRPRRAGRIVGRVAFGVIAGLIVIALIAAGAVVFTVQRSFPTLEGQITAAGLERQVTVQRDVRGIPTIIAETSDDLFFAQGFVHAQDRFWEMDFRRHVTSGRVSELFGESQLGTDKFLRTLGWRVVAEQEVEAMDPEVRAYYDAYANGVNAYLADHRGSELSLEYAVLGLQNADYEPEPWTAADSVAWLKAMAWDLRSNVEEEITRAVMAQSFSPEQIAELYPDYPFEQNPVIVPTLTTATAAGAPDGGAPDDAGAATAQIDWREVSNVVEAASALLGGTGEGIGSNSWVVSGDLTETGMPLLANDPHLGASMPSVWYQVGLRCAAITDDCGFDVSGFSFSGMPGVIIGHNDRVAWGFTNLTTDVTDLYVEKIEGDSYWRDGALVPLDIRTETIKVAGGADVELDIRSTVHGPIVSGLTEGYTSIAADPYVSSGGVDVVAPTSPGAGEYAVSMQWTALEPGTTAESIFTLNLARDFDDFRAAAAAFTVPAQNLIYADTDGNIGYQTPGLLPIRGAGDGWMPQPGWDSAHDWAGYVPADDLPRSYNPPSGYIVTANNAIVDQAYPYFLSRDWDYGYRAARITELIEERAATGPLTADDMRDIQADNHFFIGTRLANALADVSIEDSGAREAVALLAEWDGQSDADSAAAAYANVFWGELVQAMFAERDTPAPVSDHARLFLIVDQLLDEPNSEWWTNAALDVEGRDEMLAAVAIRAYDELVDLQGAAPSGWNWGSLHALTLENGSFGTSGIAPIEALFNRGPFPVGGGASVVNATGWNIGDGYATVTVPSMRLVIDLADLDASTWNHLTGASGHAYHPNYADQTEDWQHFRQSTWAFSPGAVSAASTHTLRLTPAG